MKCCSIPSVEYPSLMSMRDKPFEAGLLAVCSSSIMHVSIDQVLRLKLAYPRSNGASMHNLRLWRWFGPRLWVLFAGSRHRWWTTRTA
jgi:hypothetical protein